MTVLLVVATVLHSKIGGRVENIPATAAYIIPLMARTNQCSLSVLEWYMQFCMGQQVPNRSSAVNASKDMFIGKVCRELKISHLPAGRGVLFPPRLTL